MIYIGRMISVNFKAMSYTNMQSSAALFIM